MARRRFARFALAAGAVIALTGAAPKKKSSPPPANATQQAPAADPAAAKRAFEKLKTLEGLWKATYAGKTSNAVFEMLAGGAAVEQRSGFVAMYYLQDDMLTLFGFTLEGNRPRLRSRGMSAEASSIDFDLVDIANLKAGDGHVTGMTLRFVNDDEVVQTFRWREGTKDTTFDVSFQRAYANTLK